MPPLLRFVNNTWLAFLRSSASAISSCGWATAGSCSKRPPGTRLESRYRRRRVSRPRIPSRQMTSPSRPTTTRTTSSRHVNKLTIGRSRNYSFPSSFWLSFVVLSSLLSKLNCTTNQIIRRDREKMKQLDLIIEIKFFWQNFFLRLCFVESFLYFIYFVSITKASIYIKKKLRKTYFKWNIGTLNLHFFFTILVQNYIIALYIIANKCIVNFCSVDIFSNWTG